MMSIVRACFYWTFCLTHLSARFEGGKNTKQHHIVYSRSLSLSHTQSLNKRVLLNQQEEQDLDRLRCVSVQVMSARTHTLIQSLANHEYRGNARIPEV